MIINPMICEGDHGGIAQGAGQALWENVAYDASGQLLTVQLPRLRHAARRGLSGLRSEAVDIPAKTNPLGIKGIGESGTIGVPPTIVNAVLDALRPLVSSTSTCHSPLCGFGMPSTQRDMGTTIERSCGKLKVIPLFIATFDCPAPTATRHWGPVRTIDSRYRIYKVAIWLVGRAITVSRDRARH